MSSVSAASVTSRARSLADGNTPLFPRTQSYGKPPPPSHPMMLLVPIPYIPVPTTGRNHFCDYPSRHYFPPSQTLPYPWAPTSDWVSNTCPQCGWWPRHPNHRFCTVACAQSAAMLAPKLLKLAPNHVKYLEIMHRFARRWIGAHPPMIRDIFMITWTEQYHRDYEQYRGAIESVGQFTHRGFPAGNEQKQFRCAARACTLGERGNLTPCNHADCHVCETIRLGFGPHLQRKRQSYSGVRLGAGIYTTRTSSKADQYAININDPRSSIKAMFVCRVVVGRPFVTYRDDPTLTSPPAGYDSVCGKPGPSSQFVDDECVVYDADAVRAAYLILYDTNA